MCNGCKIKLFSLLDWKYEFENGKWKVKGEVSDRFILLNWCTAKLYRGAFQNGNMHSTKVTFSVPRIASGAIGINLKSPSEFLESSSNIGLGLI